MGGGGGMHCPALTVPFLFMHVLNVQVDVWCLDLSKYSGVWHTAWFSSQIVFCYFYINDMPDYVEIMCQLFVDDAKIFRSANSQEDFRTLQEKMISFNYMLQLKIQNIYNLPHLYSNMLIYVINFIFSYYFEI